MSRVTHLNNLPVYDAIEPLTLEVEACDLEGATARDPTNCVAARSTKRKYGAVEVYIHRSRAFVRMAESDHFDRYAVPPSLAIETEVFDRSNGEVFEPQSFKLSVLKPSSKTNGKRQGSDTEIRTGKMRQPPRIIKNVRRSA